MNVGEPEGLVRLTATEAVASRLRDAILRNELAPGTRLRQNDVARRFGVSTTPVREAFAQLQAEGLVRIDPHRGAIVFHPTTDDLRECYLIREELESLAVVQAVPNLTPQLLSELGGLIGSMRKLRRHDEWVELNDRFHLTLYEASGMTRLCSLIRKLRDASAAYIYMFVARQPPASRTDDEHQQILDACRDGDPERAEAAVRTHLRHAARDLLQDFTGATPDGQVPPR